MKTSQSLPPELPTPKSLSEGRSHTVAEQPLTLIAAARQRMGALSQDTGVLDCAFLPAVLGGQSGLVFTEVGRNNYVAVPHNVAGMNLRIGMRGHNNLLIIEDGANLQHQSRISMEGSDGVCVVRKGAGSSKASLTLRGAGATMIWGENCTANDVTALAHGTHVIFGEDCLMSWGIIVRSYDSHAIIDLRTGTQVNRPKPVVIGPRVWIGQDCLIMPGVEVGRGSIIGARSLVTKSVPPRALAAGSPARILREDVTWDRSASPNADQLQRAIDLAGGPAAF